MTGPVRWLEDRVRARWSTGPGPLLAAASVPYGLAQDLRGLASDLRIVEERVAPIPVLSVGGLTVGGSGKTPVAAAVARWLAEAGWRPALVTAGISDEAAVLSHLVPDSTVVAARDRLAGVRSAASRGADVAVLDSGFQHRRLHRTLDVVCVDPGSWSLPGRPRLPAGPFRERSTAVRRADAIVVVHRSPGPTAGDGTGEGVRDGLESMLDALRRLAPHVLLAGCRIGPGRLRPANGIAEGRDPREATAAVAGVMWPEAFFEAVRSRGVAGARPLRFRDHESYLGRALDAVRSAASPAGVVCTLKDAVKLGPLLADRVPVWYLEEEPSWWLGERALRAGVARAAELAAGTLEFGPSGQRE